MADRFLGLFDRYQLPFGGVTGARARPGSPQEGPERGRSLWAHLGKPDSSELQRVQRRRPGGRSGDFRMMWRPAGSEPAKLFVAPIDSPEINVGKPDEPVAGFGLGNAHGLVDQRLGEKNH